MSFSADNDNAVTIIHARSCLGFLDAERRNAESAADGSQAVVLTVHAEAALTPP